METFEEILASYLEAFEQHPDQDVEQLIAQKIILDKMRVTPNIIFPPKRLLKSLLKTDAKAVPAL